MMQVKIIRAKPDVIEEHINEFLKQLGMTAGMVTKIEQIQLIHIGGPAQDEACLIMYNQYASKPLETVVNVDAPKRPAGPQGPAHLPHMPVPPTTKP